MEWIAKYDQHNIAPYKPGKHHWTDGVTGLQLRKSEQNSFHDNSHFSIKPYDVTLIEIVSPRRFQ